VIDSGAGSGDANRRITEASAFSVQGEKFVIR
jgi:hypothetical protein